MNIGEAARQSGCPRRFGEINHKIAELGTLRDTLVHLAEACAGDERPDCPILEDLGGSSREFDRAY